MRKSITISLALVVALAGAPALAGCSVVEGLIEQQTGGDIDLGGTSVPADFPSEVPLIDGDIVNGSGFATDGTKVWNIIVKVSDGAAFDTIKSQLEGAGFTFNETGSETPEAGTGVFDGENYGVLVVVAQAGDQGWVANYTVSQK
ncbi:hypothetical protein BH10ACT7_BH10ACT7_04730 [soil metagenome]